MQDVQTVEERGAKRPHPDTKDAERNADDSRRRERTGRKEKVDARLPPEDIGPVGIFAQDGERIAGAGPQKEPERAADERQQGKPPEGRHPQPHGRIGQRDGEGERGEPEAAAWRDAGVSVAGWGQIDSRPPDREREKHQGQDGNGEAELWRRSQQEKDACHDDQPQHDLCFQRRQRRQKPDGLCRHDAVGAEKAERLQGETRRDNRGKQNAEPVQPGTAPHGRLQIETCRHSNRPICFDGHQRDQRAHHLT